MTGTELTGLLEKAERSPGWLAGRMGRHRSHVVRWARGERPIPAELEDEIRRLLPPAPARVPT